MKLAGLIFLIVAYTLCIATIIVQIICYRKEMERKETIFFTVSFLLLIVSVIITKSFDLVDRIPGRALEVVFYMTSLLVAVSTPMNVHTERIIKKTALRNKIIIFFTAGIALLYLVSYFFHFEETGKILVLIYLNLSILYSMIVISKAKPSLSVLHREKIEKITARIFMIVFPLYALAVILNHFMGFIDESLFQGSIVLSIIAITLALSKLLDDLKRLTLFVPENTYQKEKIAYYQISNRETEVLDLLIKGYTYQVIGEKLFISLPTVKTHISNIYQKMNVGNKVELINRLNSN